MTRRNLSEASLERMMTAVATLPASVERSRGRVMQKFVDHVAEELRKRIYTQNLNVAALSLSRVKEKQRKGWDPRTFIVKNKGYAESIIGKVMTGDHVGVVFADGVDERGVPYGKIADLLELGSKRMPARPHWAPTMVWAKKEFRKWMKETARWAVRDAVQKAKR